jgi:hypothetical protein
MFEKLLVLLLQGKGLVVAGVLTTGVVVTGTFGGEAVDLVITFMQSQFRNDPMTVVAAPRLGEAVWVSPALTSAGGQKIYTVSGWSIDRDGTTGSGVAKVELFLDNVKLGEAKLGLESPEVAAEYRKNKEDDRFAKASWTFDWDVTALQSANRSLRVVAYSALSVERHSEVVVELGDPLVAFVKPEARDKVSGLVDLAGWALDRFAPEGQTTGPQIDKVELYLDDLKLGDAILGAESPKNVAARYRVAKSGWTFSWDATDLAPGEYTLLARAHSAAQTGSWTEAALLVVVEQPQADGDGCGWLIGEARGKAVQALQSGWQTFHHGTMAYKARMGEMAKDRKPAFSAEVDSTRAGLQGMRDAARAALHAKAEEYRALCLAGQLPAAVTLTSTQDVVPTAHLIYEYRSIVDKAMVDMKDFYGEATKKLDAY